MDVNTFLIFWLLGMLAGGYWLCKIKRVQEGDAEVEPRGGLVVLARVAPAGRPGQLRLRDHREAEDRHGAGLACTAGSVAEALMRTFP